VKTDADVVTKVTVVVKENSHNISLRREPDGLPSFGEIIVNITCFEIIEINLE
jgi:hypothetical protein